MSDTAAFFNCIRTGDAEGVRRLLRAEPALGAVRDENGLSPVMFARYFDQPDALRTLLEEGVELSFHEAAAVGNAQRLSLLLLMDAAQVNSFSPDGFSALQLASFFGEPEIVELLLERGADAGEVSINQMRLTALHSAAAGADGGSAPQLAELLLDAGADVDARQSGGFTPLHAAAQNGNEPLARLLIARGADRALATDKGQTAADFAREAGNNALAAML